MLSELRMEIEADSQNFGFYQSSNMQGVLMEFVEPEYVQQLHEQRYNPYSRIGKKHAVEKVILFGSRARCV